VAGCQAGGLCDLDRGEGQHGVAEGDEIDVGAEAGDHATGLGLSRRAWTVPRAARRRRQLQHAEPGAARLGDQPAVDVVEHLHVDSLPNLASSGWSICPAWPNS
jgi:hypothetical protein